MKIKIENEKKKKKKKRNKVKQKMENEINWHQFTRVAGCRWQEPLVSKTRTRQVDLNQI